MEGKYFVAAGIVVILFLFVYWVNSLDLDAKPPQVSTTCTNSTGDEKVVTCDTAPCTCPDGYSSQSWVHWNNCEKNALQMANPDSSGKKLQLINPEYGFDDSMHFSCGGNSPNVSCISPNSSKLQTDVDAGSAVNLPAGDYLSYFGGTRPCGTNINQYVSFDYRYV
jgi:hypothetical protein